VLELDLATVEPALAGPKRPQDRVPLSAVKANFEDALPKPRSPPRAEVARPAARRRDARRAVKIDDGQGRRARRTARS
jgi:aconitate hydratase